MTGLLHVVHHSSWAMWKSRDHVIWTWEQVLFCTVHLAGLLTRSFLLLFNLPQQKKCFITSGRVAASSPGALGIIQHPGAKLIGKHITACQLKYVSSVGRCEGRDTRWLSVAWVFTCGWRSTRHSIFGCDCPLRVLNTQPSQAKA